jgi:hypothetical protein
MRDVFADYLNHVAQNNGAIFWDECAYAGHEETDDCVNVDPKLHGRIESLSLLHGQSHLFTSPLLTLFHGSSSVY